MLPPKYVLRRLAQIPAVLAFVVIVNFSLIHLAPGDAATALAGDNATADYVAQLRERYGLDQSVVNQLWKYVANLVRGELGYSFSYHRPVAQLLAERVPATLLLILAGELLAIVLGTVLGAASARLYPSPADKVFSAGALALASMPIFWSGLVLILVFAVSLKGTLPAAGMHSLPRLSGMPYVLDVLRHMVLPTIALFLYSAPTYFRLTRAAVLEAVKADFVRTARSIGLGESAVFLRHALRNALLPSVTLAGVSFGAAFSGALLTETVFSWPGIGRLMYDSILLRDYPVMMGVFVLASIFVVLGNLVADLAYAILDPRVRYT